MSDANEFSDRTGLPPSPELFADGMWQEQMENRVADLELKLARVQKNFDNFLDRYYGPERKHFNGIEIPLRYCGSE